jgi:pre-mRNA-splicing factor 18
MEALRLELERKRKEREALAPAEATAGKKNKWVRRGDVEAAREAAYREAEAREAEERAKRLVVPCLRKFDGGGSAAAAGAATSDDAAGPSGDGEEEGGAPAAAGGGAVSVAPVPAASADSSLPPTEVKRLLRKLGQPIALFGENDGARLERYRAVAAALPAEDEDEELKRGQMFNERWVPSACVGMVWGWDGWVVGGEWLMLARLFARSPL